MPVCRYSFDFKFYAETKSINYTHTYEIGIQPMKLKCKTNQDNLFWKKLDGGCNSFTILESRHLS